jgi:hypothetical protein
MTTIHATRYYAVHVYDYEEDDGWTDQFLASVNQDLAAFPGISLSEVFEPEPYNKAPYYDLVFHSNAADDQFDAFLGRLVLGHPTLMFRAIEVR